MDIVIKTTSRILFPFMLLFGTYLAFHGHLSPGGGFPAGAVIGTAFVLLLIAFREKDIEKKLPEWEIADFKSIISLALVFMVLGEFYLREKILLHQRLFDLWSGGETLILNILGSIVVASAIIIIAYSFMKEEWKGIQ